MTLHEKPPAATHWSARTLAKALGISHTSVQRIWNAHGLKPHLVKTFKLSNDKRFVEKVKDVVGLYLDPPDKALVFSVDEKSQIQALDRTQPGLPMKKGRAGTMTHELPASEPQRDFPVRGRFLQALLLPCAEDCRNRRRNGEKPRDIAAAAARGSRVFPLLARAPGACAGSHRWPK